MSQLRDSFRATFATSGPCGAHLKCQKRAARPDRTPELKYCAAPALRTVSDVLRCVPIVAQILQLSLRKVAEFRIVHWIFAAQHGARPLICKHARQLNLKRRKFSYCGLFKKFFCAAFFWPKCSTYSATTLPAYQIPWVRGCLCCARYNAPFRNISAHFAKH